MICRSTGFALAALASATLGSPADAKPTETILNGSFGTDGHGVFLFSGVVADGSGALYGTASKGGGLSGSCGVVYQLAPRGPGKTWPATTLHAFGGAGDGCHPSGGVVFDAAGNLYGATENGGVDCPQASPGCGVVYELSPPVTGQAGWTETVLHKFPGYWDGAAPTGRLVVDALTGALYGTTYVGGTKSCHYGCGTVFELVPPVSPGGTWTETVLHDFTGKWDGALPGTYSNFDLAVLTPDGAGGLYGTASIGGAGNACSEQQGFGDVACGTIFHLTPPAAVSGAWSFGVIWTFGGGRGGGRPTGAVIVDGSGALYGQSYDNVNGAGWTYRLNPPQAGSSRWTETVLHGFGSNGQVDIGALALDGSGGVYGATLYGGDSCNCGLVYRLSPPAAPGGAWTIGDLYRFTNSDGDGADPVGDLLVGSDGAVYGTTESGGKLNGGTVFRITP